MSPLVVFVTLIALCAQTNCTPLWLRHEKIQSNLQDEALNYRIPRNLVKPIKYDVTLFPYFEQPAEKQFSFEGKVSINVEGVSETNWIRMHANDLIINNDTVKVRRDYTGLQIPIHNVTYSNDDRNFFDIYLEETLEYGASFTIQISFTGKLNDELEGFYRSKYVDQDGNTKWLGVTQFEEVGARRAFPCFDEPLMKAKFIFHIAHSGDHTVLSNMPQNGDDPLHPSEVYGLEGWSMAHFEESSHDMSTFLVAFTVSDFQELQNSEDPRFKIWTRPGTQNSGALTNSITPKIVNYMEEYTGHNYSLSKLDQIAIPDKTSGGMENWGLITYRESRLMFEEGISTSNDRQLIEQITTHELAHQWFGNIVSPMWWEHIWLSEGFATYFEYHALASIENEWQLEEQFIIQQMHDVLLSDALNSTHPLLAVVDTPASAEAAFDSISYYKGSCIVRFIIYVMGLENFKAGINEYLTYKEFSFAEPKDLWYSLTPHVPPANIPSSVNFVGVMNTWTNQAGYPVVNINRNYKAEKPSISIKQERFINLKDPNISYDERWWVALTMTSQNNISFEDATTLTWFKSDIDTFLLPDEEIKNEDWILFNIKQIGFYRVNYDQENWAMLTKALVSQTFDFHVINRAQLMDDALALARANLLDYNTALDTTSYLHLETEYAPWAAAISATSFLKERLNNDGGSRELFQWYVLDKMSTVYDDVNGLNENENDTHMMRIKRSIILKSACDMGHRSCNDESVKRFKQWKNENIPVSPDLKSVVYCAGMKNGGQEEYDFLFEKYSAVDSSASEKDLILTALGCSSDVKLLQAYLDESIAENSKIPPQSSRTVHSSVYSNYLGVDIALDFIIDNWKTCITKYSGASNVALAFTGVSSKCNTEEQKKKLVDLLGSSEAEEMDETIRKAVKDSITTVDETLVWQTDNRDIVVEYFRVKKADSGSISVLATPTLLLALIMALYTLFN